jgi:hypothetical protein
LRIHSDLFEAAATPSAAPWHLRRLELAMMAVPDDGMRHVRLRCPETNRWRTYELDAALDAALVQRLNDLAFLHGAEIVSTCAGHEVRPGCGPGHPEIGGERAFAEVRFAIFYPSRRRLAAQQARICIEALARACAGDDTVIETFHEPDLDRHTRTPRGRRLGRSLVAVHHAQATAEAPALAQVWWRRLVDRLERSGP